MQIPERPGSQTKEKEEKFQTVCAVQQKRDKCFDWEKI